MWSSISIGMLCPTDSKRLLLEYNVKVYWYYDIHEALLSCCMLANHCAQVINTYQDWLINGFWENWWVWNAEIMNICSCLLVLSATYINVYKLAFHVQHENMVEVAFCKPFFLLLLLLLPLPVACSYISVSFVILWEWVSFWSSSHFPYVAISGCSVRRVSLPHPKPYLKNWAQILQFTVRHKVLDKMTACKRQCESKSIIPMYNFLYIPRTIRMIYYLLSIAIFHST